MLLPAQFLAARPTKPERRLMAAVLERAVEDCRFAARHPDSAEAKALVRELRAWFFVDDYSWPYSFVSLCDEFNLGVAWMRRQVAHVVPAFSRAAA